MSSTTKKKILVVEDNADAAMMAGYALEQEGYEAVIASDGESGLAMAIDDEDIDLVVLDVMLPGMDGFQVCAELRNRPETEALPVVMLAALGSEQDKFNGLALSEANVYITKPADQDEFLESVKTLLREYPHPRGPKSRTPS